MRKLWGIFFAVFFLTASQTVHAATFYPLKGWQTIKTSHFAIHFEKKEEAVAKRAAGYFEEAFTKLSPQFRWKPWGRTQVILTDNFDESNGLASTLPYNWILLRLAPPDPESSLNTYDNWLKTLILHEYTHIMHLDAYGGFWTPWHYIFGKLITPAAMTPGWNREGIATLEETDETKGGRGRAALSEMMVRTAVLYDKFPPIDRADGVHWKWPGSQTQYIFGVKFLQYLENRFGKDQLLAFERMTERSFWIGNVNHDAKVVFGKSISKLWKEWQVELREKYGIWEEGLKREGITATEGYLSGEDSFYLPTFSRDGKMLAYVALSPKKAPVVWLKNLETGKKIKLLKQRVPGQMSFSPDDKSILFSSIATFQRVHRYYDLFKVDIDTRKVTRLTQGARARDPDISPDGTKILFASNENGTDTLNIYDVASKKIDVLENATNATGTQFANARYSPDGSKIALVRFNNNVGWELYVYTSDGAVLRRVTHNGLPVESRPAWSADGKTIVFSSDEDGVNNLYAYDWGLQKTRRLTHVTTGVFQPALSPEGDLLARYYNAEGYDVRKIPYVKMEITEPKEKKKTGRKEKRGELKTENRELGEKNEDWKTEVEDKPESWISGLKSKKYNAFGQSLFLPRYVLPGFQYLSDGFLVTAATGGNDPLHYHNWTAGPTFREGPNYLGYFANYSYNRLLPVMGLGINDFAVDFGTLSFSTGNTYHFYEKRRNAYTYFSMPLGSRMGVGASYFYEDRNAITPILPSEAAALNLGVFAGINLTYVYGQTVAYPASISHPEQGRRLKLQGTITDARLLSAEKNEQQIFMGDYREYLPLGRNNVFAVRAAGGFANGDSVIPGTFTLGGDLGEGVLAGAGYTRYFSLRGLPVASFDRNRVMLLSGEYRLPLVSPQRGLGTSPFFLNNLHMGFFADYGDAWNAIEPGRDSLNNFFDKFMLGVGTELRADMVIGHGLPVTGRLGYGIIVTNRNRLTGMTDNITGKPIKNGTLILQFGTSF
ncbi:MAG: hypothetical protein Q7T03_02215 [Deltaproteobacteria bacterium]|nr:hypothetical protein [Deltaproteobacteria bacterium]